MPEKIIVVSNDLNQRAKISAVFEDSGAAGLTADFRSCAETAEIPYGYHDYIVGIVDFGPDPLAALIAARFIRSVKPELDLIVLTPSEEFDLPSELAEISPVIVNDASKLASLPDTVSAIAESARKRANEKVVTEDLKKRNKELRDITDTLARQSVHLLRLRNELSAEKSKIETVINGMADGMAFFGVNGGLEVANPVAMKLFRGALNENITLERFIENLRAKPAKAGADNDSPYETYEAEIKGKILRIRTADISDAEGAPAGSLALLTDITKEKEYENLKDDFSSMISHELRTPLTSISAAVDNLRKGNLGAVNDEQSKFLDLIARNVERQQMLIDDLLDLAKFEKGQMRLNKESVSLNSLAKLVAKQFSFAFQDKGVALETDLDTGLPAVEADADLMDQVMNNLFSNALKFTDRGGKVSVSAGEETVNDTPWIFILMEDTGIGIEHEHIEKIFDKYTQADSSKKRKYQGTGLGLAICKEIMEVHGGSITVNSVAGKGSAFKIQLPITTQAEEE